jgi:hypothetical protein
MNLNKRTNGKIPLRDIKNKRRIDRWKDTSKHTFKKTKETTIFFLYIIQQNISDFNDRKKTIILVFWELRYFVLYLFWFFSFNKLFKTATNLTAKVKDDSFFFLLLFAYFLAQLLTSFFGNLLNLCSS